MEEDIMILESECYYLEELGYLRENNHFIRFNQALKNLIKRYKELDKDNNDLRRLYRRTAVKLKEKGHEEVAGYFLAQINEVPTFTIEDDIDYYTEYYKMKTKIRETEENLKIATAMLTKGQYPEKNKGDNDFNKQFIPKSKIKEIFDRLNISDIEPWSTYKVNGQILFDLQELMEE